MLIEQMIMVRTSHDDAMNEVDLMVSDFGEKLEPIADEPKILKFPMVS